jgi:hypothetical protein
MEWKIWEWRVWEWRVCACDITHTHTHTHLSKSAKSHSMYVRRGLRVTTLDLVHVYIVAQSNNIYILGRGMYIIVERDPQLTHARLLQVVWTTHFEWQLQQLCFSTWRLQGNGWIWHIKHKNDASRPGATKSDAHHTAHTCSHGERLNFYWHSWMHECQWKFIRKKSDTYHWREGISWHPI